MTPAMDTDDLALAHTTAKLGSTGTDPQVTKKNLREEKRFEIHTLENSFRMSNAGAGFKEKR